MNNNRIGSIEKRLKSQTKSPEDIIPILVDRCGDRYFTVSLYGLPRRELSPEQVEQIKSGVGPRSIITEITEAEI